MLPLHNSAMLVSNSDIIAEIKVFVNMFLKKKRKKRIFFVLTKYSLSLFLSNIHIDVNILL